MTSFLRGAPPPEKNPGSAPVIYFFPAVQCGPLVMPMNATSYGELTTYPNKVYFQCDEGFILKGSSVRVCLANGSWSGNDTACEGVSSPVLVLSFTDPT